MPRAVFTSDHALKLEWIPNWVAIIGSGYIGLEFSDVYTALGSEVGPLRQARARRAPPWSGRPGRCCVGAESDAAGACVQVTFIEALPNLMPGFDKEIAKLAQRLLIQGRPIDYHTNVIATKVTPGAPSLRRPGSSCGAPASGGRPTPPGRGQGRCGARGRAPSLQGRGAPAGVPGVKPVIIELTDFKTKEKVDELEVDACLVATGRSPYTNGLNLSSVNVETDRRGFLPVNDKMQVCPPPRGASRGQHSWAWEMGSAGAWELSDAAMPPGPCRCWARTRSPCVACTALATPMASTCWHTPPPPRASALWRTSVAVSTL